MTSRLMSLAGVAAAVALLYAAGLSRGDTVTKGDGTVYTGKIKDENSRWVIIEATRDGKTFTIPIPRSQILTIEHGEKAPAPEKEPATPAKAVGPGYYALPIVGEIGVEVQASFLATALADVRKVKPDYLVLVFDSEGGSAREAVKLIDLIKQARKDRKVVGLIRKATGPAAAVAMAVPELYIQSAGQIGDATGVAPGRKVPPPDGAGLALLRSRLPAEAKAAGHPDLLARAFVDPSMELAIGAYQGKPVLNKGRGGKVITTDGAPLVLTGQDAVDAGLAKGIADGADTLPAPMGLKAWHVVRGTGWAQMSRDGQDCRRKLEAAATKERRDAYMAKFGPRLEQIDKEIAEARENGKKAEQDKRDLERRYQRDLREIENDYKASCRSADRWADSNPGLRSDQRRRAKEQRDDAIKNLRKRLEPDVDRIKDDIRKWARAIDRLQEEKRQINRGIPR